jgi:hypothetical protein
MHGQPVLDIDPRIADDSDKALVASFRAGADPDFGTHGKEIKLRANFFRLPKVLRRCWNEPSRQSNTRWSCEARPRLPVASAPDGRGPVLRLRRKRSVTVAGLGQQDIHAHDHIRPRDQYWKPVERPLIVDAFKAFSPGAPAAHRPKFTIRVVVCSKSRHVRCDPTE